MRLSANRRRPRLGFSMVEIAIALTVAGLLAMIAVPKVRTALRMYALEEATARFHGDVVRAQTLAIKLNRTVVVARSGTTGYTVDGGATRLLPNQVTFDASSAASTTFASFGPPTTGTARYILMWDTKRDTVEVNAAGRVTR